MASSGVVLYFCLVLTAVHLDDSIGETISLDSCSVSVKTTSRLCQICVSKPRGVPSTLFEKGVETNFLGCNESVVIRHVPLTLVQCSCHPFCLQRVKACTKFPFVKLCRMTVVDFQTENRVTVCSPALSHKTTEKTQQMRSGRADGEFKKVPVQ